MMSWLARDKEAMQKLLRESILQLCRINIGMPGSYEVDGIVCITRCSSSDVDGNTDEDQIVVKVHEHITTNVPVHSHASILHQFLASQNVPARMTRNSAHANPMLNLKRKANDENDNAIIDVNDASVKVLRCGVEADDQAEMRSLLHARLAKVSTGNLTERETHCSRLKSFSCGSCLLDFDSWVSLQSHFQQSHSSCLDHYCRTCAVGFLSAADLGKHNASVHQLMSSTVVIGSRRKQNKPRRGVMNDELPVPADHIEDETDLCEDRLKLSAESQHSTGDVRPTSADQPLLQKRPLTKILREDSMIYAKQEQPGDLISNAVGMQVASERICPHCTSFFADFSTFSVHCQAVHRRFPCPRCLQTFTQRVNRDRHLCNHAGRRPYDCEACGDGFTQQDALMNHQTMCSQLGVTLYGEEDVDETDEDSVPDVSVSDGCGLDLSVPSNQLRRLKEDPADVWSGCDEDNVSLVVSKTKSFRQPSTTTVQHSALPVVSNEWTETAAHRQSVSDAPPTTVPCQRPAESRMYSCDICRASAVGAMAFEFHCRSEHRRTPCVYCGKTFSQKGNMERHQRQHTGERPFACPHCSCSYTRKETLKVHINQAHPAAASDTTDDTARH